MEILEGKSVFGGFAHGHVLCLRHDRPAVADDRCADDGEAVVEAGRFHRACDEVVDTLHALMTKGGSDEEVAILEAQSLMVRDPEFTRLVEDLILKEHHNAAHAVECAAHRFIATLSSIDSPVTRENISDIQDIASRIISVLTKEDFIMALPDEASIIIADTVLPSELLAWDSRQVAALCLDGGGQASHVSILARALGIPCVIGLGDASHRAHSGQWAALDAFEGRLYLDPDDGIVSKVGSLMEEHRAEKKEMEEDAVLPAITLDGVRVELECNIEGLDFVDMALRNGAEGVGLFRTEFLLMRDHVYSEDEQVAVYLAAARAFRGRGPVTIRTYDMGGDKVVKDLTRKEENPVLGWRAVRFCMDRKDIFRTQLRAVLRASAQEKVRLMFPMVSGCDELDDVLLFFESVKEGCRKEGIAFDEHMEVGTMIEVPSAAVISDILARKVDFFSVGTNDLTQYTIAVDRGNEKTASLYKEYHPAMLRLLDMTARNAASAGIGLAMCGEMAGDPLALPLVLGLGYRTLSMNPASLLEARHLIRHINMADCQALAKKALDMQSCRDMERLLEGFHAEIGNN